MAIDSHNRTWVASGSTLRVLDPNGTLLDPTDDEWESYEFNTHWRSQNYAARMRIDPQDRLWLIQNNTSGIKVLSNIAQLGGGDIPWTTLFPDENGDPVLHMHVACGRGDSTITGCVRRGVKTWHVLEIVLFELVGSSAVRTPDPATGFKLLQP